MLTSAELDLRADQETLVEAVAMMLPHGSEPTPPLPLQLREGSAVTILRGFDRTSRGARDALRNLLSRHDVTVHDLAPAPTLGTIPTPWQTDLVIAASRAVATTALRCASRWGAAVIIAEEDVPSGATLQLTARSQPAASVTTPGQATDVVTRALRINGPVTCSLLKGKPRPSEGLRIEPSSAALCLTFDLDTDHPHTRTVSGPVTLDLRHSTTGYIDEVPHLFGRGQSYVSTAGKHPTRIFVRAQQDQS